MQTNSRRDLSIPLNADMRVMRETLAGIVNELANASGDTGRPGLRCRMERHLLPMTKPQLLAVKASLAGADSSGRYLGAVAEAVDARLARLLAAEAGQLLAAQLKAAWLASMRRMAGSARFAWDEMMKQSRDLLRMNGQALRMEDQRGLVVDAMAQLLMMGEIEVGQVKSIIGQLPVSEQQAILWTRPSARGVPAALVADIARICLLSASRPAAASQEHVRQEFRTVRAYHLEVPDRMAPARDRLRLLVEARDELLCAELDSAAS